MAVVAWGYLVGAGLSLVAVIVAALYSLYLWRRGLVHRYDVVSHELDGEPILPLSNNLTSSSPFR
jgi:hypothetical protein